MKTKTLLLMLLIILILAFTSSAEIPHIINYQGKATDAQGAPLNGAYNLTFRIYNHATAGDLLWSETHSNLNIVNGIFSVHLGDVTPLTLPFDAPYWLSIEVNTDGEMSPRVRLAASPYAYKAELAVTAENLSTPELPSGIIVMWSGNIANIPTGWALCDGNNGTPDLRDKFIISARQDEEGIAKTNLTGNLTFSGGNINHTHIIPRDGWGEQFNDGTTGRLASARCQSGDVTSANGVTNNNMQSDPPSDAPVPYYALAFIMKI